jgi:hypothetical protein
LSLPPTKKAMYRLSGDHIGRPSSRAPSVPAIGRASTLSIGRSQSCALPAESTPRKTRLRPSGEIRGEPTVALAG